jgi:alpha-mannosidase
LNFTQRLEKIIANLHSLSQIDILHQWSCKEESFDFQPLPLNEKGIIAFDRGGTHPARNHHVHIQQTWSIPESANGLSAKGATLRLELLWWASLAEIYINGSKVHTGDLFDQKCRLLLAENIEPDRTFTFDLKLTAPKHDRGALQKSDILIEYPHQPCDPGKLATELGVIHAYLPHLLAANFHLEEIVSQFEQLLSKQPDRDLGGTWLLEVANIRRSLLPIGEFLKQRKVYLLGNAHIDVAWLWAIAETKDVMQRTFSSALQLQKDYPELIFNQSTALSYLWMEEEHPELFAQIQTAVQAGKWEAIGGMWVEPDCNLPSGESLIRQILYGKKYFLSKFNRDIKIAWLPDTFGFNWQLPQILSKSGFEAVITQKLTWNDTNKFPHQIFWWQGLDGSKIFTYFSNEIGLGIEPVAIAKFLSQQEQQHHMPECLWLYGVGDRGGGPTADMLNIGREWANSEMFFTLESSTAENFILKLKQEIDRASIPCWRDELYLEFHRGTYTTKADQKRQHRQAEILITNTEKLCAIASILQQADYPKPALEKAWHGLMLNQFHDILPGTSIPEVFADADLVWAEIRNICKGLTDEIFTPSKSQSKSNEDISFTLWNFLNWSRTEVVEIENFTDVEVVNLVSIQSNNTAFPTQAIEKGLLIVAQDIPSFGTASYKLLTADSSQTSVDIPPLSVTISQVNSEIYLENQYLKVTINSQTGEIAQIFDRRYGNSLLSKPCELQFFEDKGQYWDAWNIDPDYESKQLAGIALESIEIREQGPIRVSLRVVRKFGRSRFQQDIYLDAYSDFVTVTNHVDWQEDYVLVKVAFPLSFSSPIATYEIPMGAIARSTMAETAEAKAKFEVPAQFWADLSSEGVGLSILNDCKYGYDAKPSQLRLTLLRSPNWPSPNSDKGTHDFTYRLLPHQGSWQNAQVVRAGYNLNSDLMISFDRNFLDLEQTSDGTHPERNRFSTISISSTAIVISALKLAEGDSSWILRLYEAHGESVTTEITFLLEISSITECNLIEQDLGVIAHSGDRFECEFLPHEIKTFKVCFSPDR